MPETEAVTEAPAKQQEQQDEPQPRTVPLSELQKERRAKKDLEERLAQLEQQAEERRQAELSDAERLKEQLAQAEARAVEAETKAQKSERRGWIRDAASAAGFIDPGDAVAQIDTSDLDSEAAAREAVADLKSRKPHLAPESTGPASLQKVLQDGKRPEDGKPEGDEKLLTKAEMEALSQAQIRALEDDKPGLLDRSLEALNT